MPWPKGFPLKKAIVRYAFLSITTALWALPGNHSPVCQLFALLVAFVVSLEFLGGCIDRKAAMKDKILTKRSGSPFLTD